MIVILVLVAVVLIALIIALMVIYFIELKYSDKNVLKANKEVKSPRLNQTSIPQRPSSIKPSSGSSKKSLEWFESEEGKKLFDKSIDIYWGDDFQNFREEHLSTGDYLDIVKRSCRAHKQDCPFTFFYEYFLMLNSKGYTIFNRVKEIKDYANKKGINVSRANLTHDTIYLVALETIMTLTSKVGFPLIDFPDILKEDKNPILYFLTHFDFLERKIDLTYVDKYGKVFHSILAYISFAYADKKLDLSKDTWIYEKSTFQSPLQPCLTEKQIYLKVIEKCNHKKYLPENITNIFG